MKVLLTKYLKTTIYSLYYYLGLIPLKVKYVVKYKFYLKYY